MVDEVERECAKATEEWGEDGKDEKGNARESERVENKVNGSFPSPTPRKTTRQQRATMLPR